MDTTRWDGIAGFEKPVGLARDRLGALYLTSPDVERPKGDAKHAVAKLHPTPVVTVYAEHLEKPQGLAFDADGNLYVADGTSGRVLRFLAPRPPTLTAPGFTNHSSLVVMGTTLAGARVDLFVNDALTPTTVTADSAGRFSASNTLTPNVSNTLEAFATSHGGHGLTSRPAEASVVHDDIRPTVTFVPPTANAYVRQTVTVQAQATDTGSGVATFTLRTDSQALIEVRMKARVVVFVLLLLAPMTGWAQGNKVNGKSQAQSQVDALAAKLANGEIGKVEILQIPSRILTRIRITPTMLEKQFHYKLTIRDVRTGAYQDKLVEAARSIAVQPGTEIPDLRWGVVFYSLDDSRVGALYFAKTGSSGAVGDAPVSFKGNFFKWLDRNFSTCFR